MSSLESSFSGEIDSAVRDVAARWVIRRDRGFSPVEAAEFERWLQEDPRHAAAIARSSAAWSLLDRIPAHVGRPVVPIESTRSFQWRWPALSGLAAAALVALFYIKSDLTKSGGPSKHEVAAVVTPVNALQSKLLPDGTLVRLNVGAEVREHFTALRRSVELTHGEAHFTVTKDATRPFVVLARGVEVYAVGTAFNVRLDLDAVDVLVTEGKVQVTPPKREPNTTGAVATSSEPVESLTPPAAFVVAGHRAIVTLAATDAEAGVTVSEVPAVQLAEALAWREPLVRLGGATLAELTVEFERQTGRRLVLADPALANLRVGGRFHSDDVDGFIRILEQNYGIKSERATDGTLYLGKKP